jgi:Multiubiquitin
MSHATQQQKKDEKTKHEFTIVVNGQQKVVTEHELSFDEVVSLAYDGNPPMGDNWEFTVTFRKAHGNKQGSLVEGQTVKVQDGTVFNVTGTDKS